MDPKDRIKGKGKSGNAGSAADREIELLTELLIIQSQIESLEACQGYITKELSVLEMKHKNISMSLAEEFEYEASEH